MYDVVYVCQVTSIILKVYVYMFDRLFKKINKIVSFNFNGVNEYRFDDVIDTLIKETEKSNLKWRRIKGLDRDYISTTHALDVSVQFIQYSSFKYCLEIRNNNVISFYRDINLLGCFSKDIYKFDTLNDCICNQIKETNNKQYGNIDESLEKLQTNKESYTYKYKLLPPVNKKRKLLYISKLIDEVKDFCKYDEVLEMSDTYLPKSILYNEDEKVYITRYKVDFSQYVFDANRNGNVNRIFYGDIYYNELNDLFNRYFPE
jgi:hypothetical protein